MKFPAGPQSLKGKLTLIISLTSCLVLLLSFTVFIAFERHSLRQNLVDQLYVLSHDVADNCATAIIFVDIEGAENALKSLKIKQHIRYAGLSDGEGALLASFTHEEEQDKEFSSPFLPDLDSFETRFSADRLESTFPITYDGEQLGHIFLSSDLSPINDTLYSFAVIAVCAFLGYSFIAFLIASFLQRLISQPIGVLAESMRRVAETKEYSQRLSSSRKDELGDLFNGFNSMLEEIEKREIDLRKNESHLDHMAHHDPLTGLANRLLLTARLEQSIARSRRMKTSMGVLFVDLDRFKNINDSFGHDYGDQVLCIIAERLRTTIRQADTVARLGGDEFVIVIEMVRRADDLGRFVKKLMNLIAEAITVGDHTFHVSATIGVSLFPDHGEDVQTLMTNADLAMFSAKSEGCNNFNFYSPEMGQGVQAKVLMDMRLRQALENEHFVLHYQPQYEIQTGELVGFEALLRWNDPVEGLIPPDDFISLAEETGLIVPIGEWVIATACQALKEMQEKWPAPLRMAINISPRQFLSDALIPTVAKEIYHSQVDPESVELEITESMVMNNVTEAISKMRQIKRTGVHLALDDFGTGYSSLGYLKQFPLTRLKIDRSFVRDLAENVSDQAIAHSIIALGKTLNLEVIAEGIETIEQYDFLKEAQCHQAQGFLLSRPLDYAGAILMLDSMRLGYPYT